MDTVDVTVIGAGVLGCSLARELSRYRLNVLVLERAHDVGEGSSKANSGIVHAGFHPRGGSLKGRSCVTGNRLLRKIVCELDVPFSDCGGMMVAFNEDGMEKIHEKRSRAQKNGAGDLKIVDGDAARELEPRLSSRVRAAMLAPSTAIVSPFDLVLALAQNASENGVAFEFDAEVERVERRGSSWELHMKDGSSVRTRYVVNMAGDAAALIDMQVSGGDYVVRPRLGEYIVFDKQDSSRAITHVIYQAAESDEGGTLLAPTVDGNLLAGPTSRNVARFSDVGSTREGLDHIERVARKLIPDLDFADVIRNFAGVRTNIVNVPKELKDFVVRVSAPGFVSALGIKNPGLTSSPALVDLAVSLLRDEGLELRDDPTFSPMRKRYVPYLQRSITEQRKLVERDSAYERVVCRCENVTEGDVRAICDMPLPPTTLAGVKRRLRCGMGRCQGSFCEPRVTEALATAQMTEPWKVSAGEHGGRFVLRSVK